MSLRDLFAAHVTVAGVDCILGLKIDIDEISGGGKSMFMIMAIGIPVIV